MTCEKAIGQVINIGGVEEVSMKDLAEKIIQKSNSNSVLAMIPYEKVYSKDFEDMPRRVPSTDKLHSLIGMRPEICLDEILDDIIEKFRIEAK